MIPRTFPSTFASNGQQQMVVYSLPSVTGLTAWIDYIPVKGVTTESATLENTYANGGYQVVDSLASLTGKQAWLDYIPVYEDASYTKPWSTDAGGYIPTSALAALLLDFTSGRLDPRITFSRTTNATLTNSAGLIANAPMNLLTFSEQFDNAAWTKFNATITANSVIAPNGTITADKFTPNSSSNEHSSYQSATPTSGVNTISLYAKADGYSWVALFCNTGANAIAYFNLSTGVVGTVSGSASVKTATITPVGDGWYRCVLTATAGASAVSGFLASPSDNTPTYLGDGTSGIYIWGAQLEISSTATTYNPTTVKNLLGFTENFDNAAWTKSNAFVQTNLFTYSQDFDNAAWTKTFVTTTQNSTTAPNGTITAALVAETTSTNNHFLLSAVVAMTSGTAYTLSVFMKKGSGATAPDIVQLTLPGSIFGVNQYANYNISTGVVTASAGGALASISSAGDDWYRLTYTATATSTGSAGIGAVIFVDNDPLASRVPAYAGVVTSDAFLWGAQLVQGTTPGDYKATYAAAAAVGYPDIYGQPFAQKLVEDTNANKHQTSNASAIAATLGQVLTFSLYAKAAERSRIYVEASTGIFGSNITQFNLADGSVVSGGGQIVDIGNGWYRCSTTLTVTTAGSAFFYTQLGNGTSATYTGDGTSGIYIFGAQLSDSASVDPYVYQPVAAPTSTAYYGPRFDYDPVTLAPKGLLVEEQRSNLLTYSEQFDNAAWTKSRATITANTIVAPDGTVTADKLVANTDANTHFAGQNVSLTSGVTYTLSSRVKAGEYSQVRLSATGTGAWAVAIFDLATGAVVSTFAGTGANIQPLGDGWYVISLQGVADLTGTTTFALAPAVGGTANFTGDGTSGIYIWGAQLEAGSFATSYTPTSASQVTRAADSASMIGNNFARWYTQGVGTLFGESQKLSATVNAVNPVLMLESLAVDRQGIQYTTTPQVESFAVANSLAQANFLVSTTITNPVKTAYAYKVNDFAASVNGAAALTDNLGIIPEVNALRIGNRTLISSQFLNGHIARISYFNRRLANAELIGITS